VQESTCIWKLPNIRGRRSRCWELRGETKERKNPRRKVSKHRQKVTCWVTHWNREGR